MLLLANPYSLACVYLLCRLYVVFHVQTLYLLAFCKKNVATLNYDLLRSFLCCLEVKSIQVCPLVFWFRSVSSYQTHLSWQWTESCNCRRVVVNLVFRPMLDVPSVMNTEYNLIKLKWRFIVVKIKPLPNKGKNRYINKTGAPRKLSCLSEQRVASVGGFQCVIHFESSFQ